MRTTSEAETEAKQVVAEFAELWSEQDAGRIPEIVSDSFIHTTPVASDRERRGPEGEKALIEEVAGVFPDLEMEILDVLAEEDTVVAEYKLSMTHDGEFDGIPPTSREGELRGVSKSRVEDGKLTEYREYLNLQELLEQLGVEEE